MLPGGGAAAATVVDEGPKDMPIILSRTVVVGEGEGEGEGKTVVDGPKDDSLTFGVGSLFVAR